MEQGFAERIVLRNPKSKINSGLWVNIRMSDVASSSHHGKFSRGHCFVYFRSKNSNQIPTVHTAGIPGSKNPANFHISLRPAVSLTESTQNDAQHQRKTGEYERHMRIRQPQHRQRKINKNSQAFRSTGADG
jgi:hypothetical protein